MSFVCPSWCSFILYNPVRKVFTDRPAILRESEVNGDTVALEIGAGNGFLTEVLAAAAKRVYSVELQEGMIRKLRSRVRKFGDKVSIIPGDIAAVSLPEGGVDVCLLYYCFHEVGGKERAAANISRAVKKGGVLSIYEPTLEVGRAGMQKTASMFAQRGFSIETERNGFLTRFVKLRKR